MQDTTIEHKLPNWNGKISFFIEAAGDIYRELCHDPVDIGGYIYEKRRKLKTFSELRASDISEIGDTMKKHSDWHDLLDEYMMAVDALSSATEKFQFGSYEKVNVYGTKTFLDRKELMLAALEAITATCLYARGDFTKEETGKVIRYVDELFNVK